MRRISKPNLVKDVWVGGENCIAFYCWSDRHRLTSFCSLRGRRSAAGPAPGVQCCPVVRPVSTSLSPAQRTPSLLGTPLQQPGHHYTLQPRYLFLIYCLNLNDNQHSKSPLLITKEQEQEFAKLISINWDCLIWNTAPLNKITSQYKTISFPTAVFFLDCLQYQNMHQVCYYSTWKHRKNFI